MRSTWEWEWQGRDDGHCEVLVRGYVERVVISCAVAVRLVVDELLGEADLTFEAEGREAVEMLAEWARPKPASNLLPI